MNAKPFLLALGATVLLAACQSDRQDSVAEEVRRVTSEVSGEIAATAGKTADEVRRELASGNLPVGNDYSNKPRAEITPEGELLIDGKAQGLDEGQRALARDYREQLIDVAASGAEIGVQAAALASDAVGATIASIFEGKGADVGAQIEAQAGKIEQAARSLCDRLPRLLETQSALVAAVPSFEPYAKVHAGDGGTDCSIRS